MIDIKNLLKPYLCDDVIGLIPEIDFQSCSKCKKQNLLKKDFYHWLRIAFDELIDNTVGQYSYALQNYRYKVSRSPICKSCQGYKPNLDNNHNYKKCIKCNDCKSFHELIKGSFCYLKKDKVEYSSFICIYCAEQFDGCPYQFLDDQGIIYLD